MYSHYDRHQQMDYADNDSTGRHVNCPTEDCTAMHEVMANKFRCNHCGALLKTNVEVEVIREAEARQQDPKEVTTEAEDRQEEDDSGLGGFDEPFSVPDHYTEQKVV